MFKSPAQRRFWVVLIVLAVVPVIAFWGLRAADVARGQFFEGPTTFPVASDFTVIYTAAEMVADGSSSELYDFEEFQARYAATIGDDPADNAVFAHPPIVAVVFAPLTLLEWQSAFLVWLGVSVVMLLLSSFWLSRSLAKWIALSIVVTLPAYLALMMGQLTMLWALAFVMAAIALRSGRPGLAVLPVAVLILKPTLLLGIGIWWLLDRRYHRSLALLAGVIGVIVLLTLPIVGTAWLDYLPALLDFSELHAAADAQWAQFSPWGVAGLLGIDSLAVQRVVGLVLSIAGLALWMWVWHRRGDATDVMVAAAIALALWISPHVVAYDWVLLAVAGVLILRTQLAMSPLLMRAGIALAFASLWSIVLGNWTRAEFGWTAQRSVIVFALVAVVVARAACERAADPGSARATNGPANACP